MNVLKGSRVRVHLESVHTPSLAGGQMKVELQVRDFIGVVRHLRGDHPINPTSVKFYVDPEDEGVFERTPAHGCKCSHDHVEVDPAQIVEVL